MIEINEEVTNKTSILLEDMIFNLSYKIKYQDWFKCYTEYRKFEGLTLRRNNDDKLSILTKELECALRNATVICFSSVERQNYQNYMKILNEEFKRNNKRTLKK